MKSIGKFIGTWFPSLKLMEQTYTNMTKYYQGDRMQKDPYVYNGKVIIGSIKVVL